MRKSIIPPAVLLMIQTKLTPVVNKLIQWHITATHLTWTGLVLAALAGLAALKGFFFFAAIFATLAGLMDILDGLVARQSQTVTQEGAILDSVVDRYSDFFLLAGITIRYKNFFLDYYLGFLCIIGTFMVSYAQAKSDALKVENPRDGFMKRPDRWLILTVALLLSSVRPLGHIPMFFALLTVAIGTNYMAIQCFKNIAKSGTRI